MHSNLEIKEKEVFKDSYPVIYCARGSKAQMYARKYNMECEDIQQASKKDNCRLGVRYIKLYKKNVAKVYNR